MLLPAPLEIVCDESGFTGGALAGSERVFAHASLDIDRDLASELVAVVHAAAHRHAEVKASWLLRPQRRPVLRRLLDPGPLTGRVAAHLTDTRFFLLARLVDTLLDPEPVSGISCPGQEPRRRALALCLHRAGEPTFGVAAWQRFLTSAANLLRTNNRWLPPDPVPAFFAEVNDLRQQVVGGDEVGRVLEQLAGRRGAAAAVRSGLRHSRNRSPLLEPLLPALACAVLSWGSTTRHLSVVHDEQSAITASRFAEIATLLDRRHPGHRVTVQSRADSRADPRIQVADWIAGAARRAATGVSVGQRDQELLELVLPLVHPRSVWPHELTPLAAAR